MAGLDAIAVQDVTVPGRAANANAKKYAATRKAQRAPLPQHLAFPSEGSW